MINLKPPIDHCVNDGIQLSERYENKYLKQVCFDRSFIEEERKKERKRVSKKKGNGD